MDISDQELERQLQQLMRQQPQSTVIPSSPTLDRQLRQMQAQVHAQMEEERAMRQIKRLEKRMQALKVVKTPSPTMAKYVTDFLHYLYTSFPVFTENILKSMGFSKTAPVPVAASTAPHRTKAAQVVGTMDKNFREIKKTTQELLLAKRVDKKALQNTKTILTTILKSAPARYRSSLESLRARVNAKLDSM